MYCPNLPQTAWHSWTLPSHLFYFLLSWSYSHCSPLFACLCQVSSVLSVYFYSNTLTSVSFYSNAEPGRKDPSRVYRFQEIINNLPLSLPFFQMQTNQSRDHIPTNHFFIGLLSPGHYLLALIISRPGTRQLYAAEIIQTSHLGLPLPILPIETTVKAFAHIPPFLLSSDQPWCSPVWHDTPPLLREL